VLALVSLWEGFGLPVIEAMACGTAVLTSNCSSLPEVAGDAAALADPYSVDDIAAKLERLLLDDAYRADLAARGPAQAARFTWAETAPA
jgi:glycosyltransferase involved in cell wall biosynthesis